MLSKENNPWMMVSVFLIGGILGYVIGASGGIGGLKPLAVLNENDVVQDSNSLPTETLKVDASEDDDAFMGDDDAPIVMIEFSDFQCPYCQRFFSTTLPEIKTNYIETGKVKLVYRDYPLSGHKNAKVAAEAAECAAEQDHYFEMHDQLFTNLSEWGSSETPEDFFKTYATDLGLNSSTFASCLDNHIMQAEVEADFADGIRYGVSGTPTFFVNGQKLVGAQPYSAFQGIFDKLLEE